ncbi:MAG: carboxypeptidase regulatory-like domain-containing protein [Candidatus Promineifilaceae bacterium]
MIYLTRTKQFLLMAITLGVLLLAFNSAEVSANGAGPLHRDGVVQGTVRDQYGAPLQNVNVGLQIETNGYIYSDRLAKTDWQGRYRIENVRHDNYIVRFEDSSSRHASIFFGGVFDASRAREITVMGNRPIQADVQMTPASQVNGQLSVDTGGLSARRVSVTLYRWDGVEWLIYASDNIYHMNSPYHFALNKLAEGQYRLKAAVEINQTEFTSFYPNASTLENAQTISVARGENKYIKVNMTVKPNTLLSGQVTGVDGAPLHDMHVMVFRLNPNRGQWTLLRTDYTDTNGRYTFTDLPADNYKLKFEDHDYPQYGTTYNDNQPTLGAAPHIVLSEGQLITDQDITLHVGGVIRGTLKMSDGSRLRRVRAEAYRYNGAGDWLETEYDFVWHDEDEFILEGLPVGHYRLKFDGAIDGQGTIVFWYGGVKQLEDATVIDVVKGETQTLAVVVPNGEVTIFGTVRDKEWNRLANTDVKIYKLVEHEYQNYDYWTFVTSVKTDADGTYRVEGLLPGGYTVSARDKSRMHIETYLGGQTSLADSIGFELQNGGIRSADLFMPRASSVAGRVLLQDGSVPTWGSVQLLPVGTTSKPAHHNSSASIENDGTFLIKGVSAGEYKLYFEGYMDTGTGQYRRLRLFVYSGGVEFVEHATSFHLGEGEALTGISAELGQFYFPDTSIENSISGRVTDGSTPLAGIEVFLYKRYFYRGGHIWPGRGVSVFTDANGNYQFDDLYGGYYRVGFYDPSGVYAAEYYDSNGSYYDSTIIFLKGGTNSTNINATLERAPLANVR